jgi:hypothetical protein
LFSTIQRRSKHILTGQKDAISRPNWAQSGPIQWIPTWMTCLRPSVQLIAALLLYLFHTVVLTQRSVILPFQLIPNERGNFQSVGLDS